MAEVKNKPRFAVFDPKKGTVLMEFDDMLAGKRFARAVAESVGYAVIFVDRANGALTSRVE
jgi:hypothetical protein